VDKCLILQSIKGHQYSELVVSLSVRLYMKLGCGFRGVVKVLSVLGHELGWGSLRSPTAIRSKTG